MAEDEAFGPAWATLDGVDAADLFRTVERDAAPGDVAATLAAMAAAWKLPLADVKTPVVGDADRFVVAGPSMVAALVHAFAVGRDLDWTDQVVCVATPPAHRQLAAAAGGLLNLTKKRAVVVTATDQVSLKPGAKLLLSPDADPADAVRARQLAAAK